MKQTLVTAVTIFFFVFSAQAQDFERRIAANKSFEYDSVITIYQKLAKTYPKNSKLLTGDPTDCGRPLHLFVISSDGTLDSETAHKRDKIIVFVNNGIHPGEPDGIDASVWLASDILTGKKTIDPGIVVCIVPVLNIDGALKRGCCSRANQNGPEQYGFRGNSRNLDLNRDFIKADAKNTRAFIKFFREWDPHVFVDTHVSNGADYQYAMTLISTQHNKLGGPSGVFLKNTMTPGLFKMMKEKGYEMSTYVNTAKYDDNPENGIYGFMELPRFASGYAALYHCLGFVAETHMLKPFDVRVKSTKALLESVFEFSAINATQIRTIRNKSREMLLQQKEFPLQWELDSTSYETISFKGYEPVYKTSRVTGQQQLYYDRSKPFERNIKFFDSYKPVSKIQKPWFYVVPQAWHEVIDRLKLNGVEISQLTADTIMEVEVYAIDDFKTGKDAYEGHYLHSNVSVKASKEMVQYRKGDYLVTTNQVSNRFIIETLEPTAPDSWFNWGFFDAILQQKEWFSAYVFDEMADSLLQKDAALRLAFEKKKTDDKEFAANSFSQLYFIYKNSPFFENHRRYPVGRWMGSSK